MCGLVFRAMYSTFWIRPKDFRVNRPWNIWTTCNLHLIILSDLLLVFTAQIQSRELPMSRAAGEETPLGVRLQKTRSLDPRSSASGCPPGRGHSGCGCGGCRCESDGGYAGGDAGWVVLDWCSKGFARPDQCFFFPPASMDTNNRKHIYSIMINIK